MRPRKTPKNALAKTRTVGVRLSEQDFADLTKAAEQESQRRRELVHEAVLLRELALPRVRELLAQTQAA